jgi:hypothetical protein
MGSANVIPDNRHNNMIAFFMFSSVKYFPGLLRLFVGVK